MITVEEFNKVPDNEGRWYVPVYIIFEFNSTYYSIYYDRGLSEYRESQWEAPKRGSCKKSK